MIRSFWAILFILLIGLAGPVHAVSEVTIAYPMDIPPFFFRTPAGDPQGLGIDLWRLWSRKTGVTISFRAGSFQETLEMVREGRADIHAGLLEMGSRRAFLEFAAPLFEVEGNFFYHQNLSGVNALPALRPFRIGVRGGTFYESFLRKRLPGATLVPFPTADALIRAVERGEIRVFVMSTPDALAYLQEAGLRDQFQYPAHRPLVVRSAWAAVAGDREALAETVRRGMGRITPTERAEIDRRWREEVSVNPADRLVIAMDRDFPPFSFLNADGEASGLLVDIWRLWSRKTGTLVSLRFGSWEQTLQWLRQGGADVHSGLFITPRREEWIAFSQSFYGMSARLFYPVDAGERDEERPPPGRVGVVSGSYQAQWLETQWPDVQVKAFPFLEKAFRAAEDGRVDAVLAEAPSARAILNRMGRTGAFTSEGPALYRRRLHAGVLHGNEELAARVDRGLTAIFNDELARIERRWIAAPQERYYTERSEVVRLTREEEAWLRAHPTLRVRLRDDWPPLSDIDENGDASGMYADYLALLEERLGIRFDVVSLPCEAVDDAARNREIDLFPGRLTPGRRAYLRFTRGFLEQPAVIINRVEAPFIPGMAGLAGKRVALSPECRIGPIIAAQHPAVNFVETETDLAALKRVSDGSADAFVGDLMAATYRIQRHRLPNLKIAALTGYHDEPVRFAVRSDWPLLVDILNKALETITPAEHDAIRRKWTAVKLDPWPDWPMIFQLLGTLGVGVTLLWGVILFWNRRLSAEVTERKRAEEALATSRDFLRTLIDGLPIAVFAKDAETGRFTLWNRAAESLFGMSADEALGKTDADLFPPEQAAFSRETDQDVLRKGRRALIPEESVESRHRGRRFVRTIKAPMAGDRETPPYILCIAEDITKHRRQQAELSAAKEAAEAANRAKSAFLARMSHEIRTPMNAVIGMAQLALHTDLTDEQRDYIRNINVSAHSLLGLINDILDFSRIEAGKLSMESVPFDLEETLEKVMNLNGLTAERKGIELLLSAGADLPTRLSGDPLRLEQVLNNLVSNAVKFTESGEIELSVVRLAAPAKDGRVRLRFAVRDTGIGMTPAQMDRLFESFSQADESTTRRFGGSGLGLAICKRLVEMMDGEIRVESAVGAGSTFTFTAFFEQEGEAASEERKVPAPDLRGMRVLVVDDNATARRILCETLTDLGFRPTAVDSGLAALGKLVEGTPGDFRLVLMDADMPGMDGLETACRIKMDDRLSGTITVVMVTASHQNALGERSEQWCLDGFLRKPVSPSALFDMIQRVYSGAAADALPSWRTSEAALPPPTQRDGLQGLQVLLAEDNEINQGVAVGLLRMAGVSVTVARTGREAVEKLQAATPGTFDAVLMDLQMPVMDGYEATRRIRRDPRFRHLPIIAMTAHALSGEREKCLEAGMNEHLTKPVDQNRLYDMLGQLTGRVAAVPEPPAPEPESELPDLPGVDREVGLAVVGGRARIYRELLGYFARDYADIPRDVAAALAEDDRETAARLAHSLKGAGANLGAKELSAAAAALERAIRAGAEQPVSRELSQFRDALEVVVDGIRSAGFGQRPAPVCDDTASTSSAEMIRWLETLDTLLSEDDMAAVDRFDALRDPLRCMVGDPLFETVEQLGEAIETFEFDVARERLAALREGMEGAAVEGGVL